MLCILRVNLRSWSRSNPELSAISKSSSFSGGSSFTSVKGRFPDPKPSIDSRTTGDDEREEFELGNRAWPRSEKVGVHGDCESEMNDCDATEIGEDMFASSFFLASSI